MHLPTPTTRTTGFTVESMGLATSPGFFQHRMEDIFTQYLWNFVLVYVDDIIIYCRKKKHLDRLQTILSILNKSGYHSRYANLTLLTHQLKCLDITSLVLEWARRQRNRGRQEHEISIEPQGIGSREVLRKSILDVLEPAQACMAIYFDEHYKPPEFTDKVYIKPTRRPGH